MEINDTLQLSGSAPDGVKIVADDRDGVAVANLSPPRLEEELQPEVEKETELVGGEGAAPDRRGGRRGRAASSASRRGVVAVTLSPPDAARACSGDRILVVGLGNPGPEHARTRHNVGFEVARRAVAPMAAAASQEALRGLIAEGRTGPGGPRVAVLLPQTYMNDSGDSAGPARGSLKVPLDRVVVVHDEIDLPFGEIQRAIGGGLAGHNGLKSLKRGFGDTDFWRVRVGSRAARLHRSGHRRLLRAPRFREPRRRSRTWSPGRR